MRVSSPPLADGCGQAPNGHTVYHSSFNPLWLDELGIEPRMIVDAGSFDGGDALRFSAAFPSARILTIEADPERAKIVRANLKGTSIEFQECGLQDRDGQIDWHAVALDGKVHGQGSIYELRNEVVLDRPSMAQLAVTKIPGRTLASLAHELCLPDIDLLHMDIQGAEHAALLGLGDLRPKAIFIEVDAHYIGVPEKSETHRLMHRLGYRLAADLKVERLYSLKALG